MVLCTRIRENQRKEKAKKKRGFKTKREAQNALTEVEHALLKDGTFSEPSKMLYKEYLNSWLEDKRILIKESTFKTYSWLINKYIIPNLGNIELSKIRPIDIQKLYNEIINNNLLSRRMYKNTFFNKRFFKKAERWGLIKRNVASLVDRPKAYKSELKVWDIGEVKSFLKVAESSRYYIAFLLALTTGMRQGEILALRWKDIDFNNNTLSIKQTLNHAGNKIIAGAKTKSGQRSIALPNETINF